MGSSATKALGGFPAVVAKRSRNGKIAGALCSPTKVVQEEGFLQLGIVEFA
jgi:hypothetical protein